MQAVILAAGESSRFWPFNNVHKSLFRIMGKPIIFYTVKSLIEGGIRNIVIIQGPKKDVEKELSGYGLEAKIQYVVQRESKGMGDALFQAKDLLAKQFLLVLADRVNCGEMVKMLNKTIVLETASALVGSTTDTPSLFGMLKTENDKVVDIVEKPQKGKEPSNIKALGIYLLTTDFFDTYQEANRHQYDFEDTLSLYMKKNDVELILWDKDAPSLKYPWHLLEMRNYLFNKYLKPHIGKNTKIAQSAEIIGNVSIGDNVSVMEKVVIKGPCYIGDNVFIGNNAILRGGVNVEDDCAIGANMEIKNSLIMQESTTHSGFIGDSIIDQDCRIAAQFCTGNVRLDRGIIKTVVKETGVETGYKSLGAFVGQGSNIGIKVATMPGVIVGKNVTIGPSTVVMKNVSDNSKYYAKFQEIISKKSE